MPKNKNTIQNENQTENSKSVDNVVQLPNSISELPSKPVFKVTPVVKGLTPRGIEMLRNIGDIEYAKLFIKDLYMELGGNDTNFHFLAALLEAINQKIERLDEPKGKLDHPTDFILSLQREIFSLTLEHQHCLDAYRESFSTNNFVAKDIYIPESENDPEPDNTQQLKAVA